MKKIKFGLIKQDGTYTYKNDYLVRFLKQFGWMFQDYFEEDLTDYERYFDDYDHGTYFDYPEEIINKMIEIINSDDFEGIKEAVNMGCAAYIEKE